MDTKVVEEKKIRDVLLSAVVVGVAWDMAKNPYFVHCEPLVSKFDFSGMILVWKPEVACSHECQPWILQCKGGDMGVTWDDAVLLSLRGLIS
jgi:hypothetical protein